MFAVIQVGSNQYKVSEGSKIETERLDAEKGKTVTFDRVLAYVKEDDIRIGQPELKDVKVTAQVYAQIKDVRKISFKYLKRKDSAWKKGHRQFLTVLTIKSIEAK